MKTILIVSVLLLTSVSSVSADRYRSNNKADFKQELTGFMQVGAHSGGDGTEPVPLYYRGDGQYYTGIPYTLAGGWSNVDEDMPQAWEDDVEAGGLYNFQIGIEIPIVNKVMLSASFGYQFDEVFGDLTDGSDGKGQFKYSKRFIDVIAFQNMQRHRVGVGFSYHISPEGLHREYASGFHLSTRYLFDDAIGAVIQYDYSVNEHTSVGVRYTNISYDFDSLLTSYTLDGIETIIEAQCTANCEEAVDASAVGVHLTYHF